MDTKWTRQLRAGVARRACFHAEPAGAVVKAAEFDETPFGGWAGERLPVLQAAPAPVPLVAGVS